MIQFSKSGHHNLKKDKTARGGFTLVETLVAIAIFTMSILGIMSVLGSGIASTSYAKEKMAASYLAQEGIECIRNARDNYMLFTDATGLAWDDFIGLSNLSSIPCPPTDPIYTRNLTMLKIPPDQVKVSSTVSWTQSSGSYEITFSENLFNWTE